MSDQNVMTAANSKEAPMGVKVISVLSYIGAALVLILAIIVVFAGGSIIAMILSNMAGDAGMGSAQGSSIGFGILIVIAIVMLVIAAINFFIGRGLWKLQNWARIIVIVFSSLGFLANLLSLFSGKIGSAVAGLIINGLIAGYMLFSAKVKEAFAK
jgi:hypothetical protein